MALEGGESLERVRWRHDTSGDGRDARRPPRVRDDRRHAVGTEWLAGLRGAGRERVHQEPGPDLTDADLAAAKWPLARRPYLLETSLPGVFAVGDVRAGNMKRVASAVGEGSIAVSFVHRVLHE